MLNLFYITLGTMLFLRASSVYMSVFLMLAMSVFLLCNNWSVSMDLGFWYGKTCAILVFLTCLIIFLCIFVSRRKSKRIYWFFLLLLLSFLLASFTMSNLLYFYVFFEAALIPTLIMVVGWGGQPERLQAGTYLVMYTLLAALPLFVFILSIVSRFGSLNMVVLSNLHVPVYWYLLPICYLVFFVKLPIFTLHKWLPKAHVEAPLIGSMILAGLLLKLGGYGIMLINYSLSLSLGLFQFMMISLSLWGSVLVSALVMMQSDIKALVAYMSISHMSVVCIGYLSDSSWGTTSGLVTMFAHGLCSSAMFCVATFVIYTMKSRNINYAKGLLHVKPNLCFWLFVLTSISMAIPPSLNFLGEFLFAIYLGAFSKLGLVVFGICIFLSAAYNMFFYTKLAHGHWGVPFKKMRKSSSPKRDLLMIMHLAPLLMIFKSNLF